MRGQPQAATPTIASFLATQFDSENDLLIADQTTTDRIDLLVQGLIGFFLLAVVLLIGFMGWMYVRG